LKREVTFKLNFEQIMIGRHKWGQEERHAGWMDINN
jgi:hypothetical protein